jgi:ribosomal-protein-alanine N-acetyltransferase
VQACPAREGDTDVLEPVELRRPAPRFEEEFLAAVKRSRALHGHFSYPPRLPLEFREYLKRARRSCNDHHFVVEAERGTLVGVININEIVRGGFQSAYLGYYAFHPHAGRGYMSAGMRLVLDRAFRALRLHRIEVNIQPENDRSLALAARLGFRREGFSPGYLKLGGRWRDHERWALLRDEALAGVLAGREREKEGRQERS